MWHGYKFLCFCDVFTTDYLECLYVFQNENALERFDLNLKSATFFDLVLTSENFCDAV